MLLFIGTPEVLFILFFVLLFFGSNKIPEFARMMGKGIREFRKATDDIKREITDEITDVSDDFKDLHKNLKK